MSICDDQFWSREKHFSRWWCINCTNVCLLYNVQTIPMHSHLPFPSKKLKVFCKTNSPFDFQFFLDSTIPFGIRFAPPTTCDKWGLNSTNEVFVSIASNSFYKLTNSLGYWKENHVLPSTSTTPCLSSCVHQIWSWRFEFDDLFF